MIPKIVVSSEKKLVGKRLLMSFADYKVSELWKNFMPRRKEITNNLSNDLIAMTIYKPAHFLNFSPTNEFEKWAAVEVSNFDNIPPEMEAFTLKSGLYAVFNYKGLNTDDSIYRYIFGEWIPNSNYELDNRPHFEILGDKYKNNDPNSEEEIWIPIQQKQ
ncbi:GyrI-like domain-containing protein [Flavobacterium sp.]|uniref:GyrI-like domain-containing protein n=1 Tax=Flavobacterium sp. TaxID=239 RepID=UPI002C5417D9|nr:GyrI-like domain-containing protein [Flavobacterium sp.]HSD06603.1 GyrI-like domain-containing protein [Flavobacterium sp.]